MRWEPVNGFSVRSSYTQGFRAPNLPQMNQGDIIRRIDGIEDPLRADVTERPIDTGDTYRRTTRLGNDELDPEDSETWLVGFVFSPDSSNDWLSGFRIGADFWKIKLEGVVGLIEEEDQLELDVLLREQGSSNPNVIRADLTPGDIAAFNAWNAANPDDQRIPAGEAINIIGQYVNLDTRKVEGWDGSVSYATPETPAGTFILQGDVTQITKFEQEGLAQTDFLRRNGNPEWKYTASLGWRIRDFTTTVSMRYVSSVYDTSLKQSGDGVSGTYNPVSDITSWDVSSWTIWNLAFNYDFGGHDGSLNGLGIQAGVRNLTNEEPPFADESFGYFTHLHDSYGRVYWFKLGYAF